MAMMTPHIEFRHVLGELSVNRNDPCEVLRELISNSYDAAATKITFAPLKDRNGIVFLDDGTGLGVNAKINGITPWEAFFSIGKSTKKKGDAIGYKCQGSKLCFACARILVATKADAACARILVATKADAADPEWHFKIVDNPRNNLDIHSDISPDATKDIGSAIDGFFAGADADTASAVAFIKKKLSSQDEGGTGTLIVIDGLDTENFSKYFAIDNDPEASYVTNYIRFYTRHGDVRHLTEQQGFPASHRKQVSANINGVKFTLFANKKPYDIPFGYPYLTVDKQDPSIKSPAQMSRLRDGRFYGRAAKSFSVGGERYSLVLAIDGNRRAHEEYKYLARKGKGMSGIRLSDHRGLFIAVKGIKICKHQELLSSLEGYEVLSEGDSPSHYSMILEGNFDLVTNRNALSKKAFDTLSNPNLVLEIKKFLEAQKGDKVFSELLARLKRESSESLLNEQIEILDAAKKELKTRERFRLTDAAGGSHLFLSPQPGEEYLVGVLYSQLSNFPKKAGFEKYWRRIVTFSTQGIDSLGLRDESAHTPLAEPNICSVEYKYDFNNYGPFNHALAVVDYIVAWVVDVDVDEQVKDTFTCFGNIAKVPGNDFEWEISGIENTEGGTYPQKISVICLKSLIEQSFPTKFIQPPP